MPDNLPLPKLQYFSRYHLIGDVSANVALCTFFAVLLAACFYPPQGHLLTLLKKTAALDGWHLAAMAIGFMAFSTVASQFGNSTFWTIQTWACEWPVIGRRAKKYEYSFYYGEHKDEIVKLYNLHFPGLPLLTTNDSDGVVDMVDRLCAKMRKHNIEGYYHVYRMYTFVGCYVEAIVFTLVVLVVAFLLGKFIFCMLLLLLAAFTVGSLKRMLRQAADTEFDFILTSIALQQGPTGGAEHTL